jgi:hypothetical protein
MAVFSVSRPEPLLFLSSSSSVVLTRLSGPHSRPSASQKIWYHRELNPTLLICSQELWLLDHRGGQRKRTWDFKFSCVEYWDCYHLERDAVWCVRWSPAFWRNLYVTSSQPRMPWSSIYRHVQLHPKFTKFLGRSDTLLKPGFVLYFSWYLSLSCCW